MIDLSKKERAPVLYDEYGTKILHFSMKKNARCFQLHWHERIELIIIRSGNLNIQIGDLCFTGKENDLFIIYPRQPHCANAINDVIYDVVMFDFINLKNDSIAYRKYLYPIENSDIIFTNLINDNSFTAILNDIIFNSNSYNKTNPLQVYGNIYQFFSQLYTKFKNTKKEISRTIDSFNYIIDYINKNFLNNLSTKSLSKKFGYNESYFSRKFKSITGINLMKYIQILRLEYSQKLLKNTNESISAIALKCGFSNNQYFSNCFYTHFNISPSNYRNNNIR